MARPIVLSNGELHVGLNPFGMVHDFYYPYVGLENHTNASTLRHKIGLWVDGALHWIDNGEWRIEQSYHPVGNLIGRTRATNDNIAVALEFDDFVDSEMPAFNRNIRVINLTDRPRDSKLFMHQVFIISNAANNRDTVQYLPGSDAILHYKGRRAFVVGGEKARWEGPFDSYNVGLSGIEGHEGVWRDAEDGTLSQNPVEHGQVDSILEFDIHLTPNDSERVFYWIACGRSTAEALKVHRKVRSDGPVHRLLKTGQYWQEWSEKARNFAENNLPEQYRKNFIQSVLILKSHLDRRGAVIASTDSAILQYGRDAYGYCWPRDAAYVLWPLLRLGYVDEVVQYMDFARRTLREEGYFMHKFQSDGSLGSSWHSYVHDGEIASPIQTDETAVVLFMFGQLYDAHINPEQLRDYYKTMVRPMANFLSGYVDEHTKLPRASYDLWEERYMTTTYTTAVTYAALITAADLAEQYELRDDAVRWRSAAEDMHEAARHHLWDEANGYFYKGIRHFADGRIETYNNFDASAFYGAYMFGLWAADSHEIKTAYVSLTNNYGFSADNPKMPRYTGDGYFRVDPNIPGNPWFIISFWMAQYNIDGGDKNIVKSVIDMADDFMNRYQILSEQINPMTNEMVSVAPLVWSHAEFVNTLLDYKELDSEIPAQQVGS